MRNRIIAGMADAVVVVETANRGGSMITAYVANEYNKDVFAVPGRLDDPLSKGCNHLIKTHRASLLESAEDLAYILRWEKKTGGQQKQLFANLTKDERLIVDLMLGKEVHLETIIRETKISTSRMAALLLELELRGVIRALPGKNFRLL
jgi:DNA processing protein